MSKQKNEKLTISDIAKLSGVSKTTVSRFLHGKYEYMSLATREKIGKLIEQLGYRPSNIAQSLKLKRSHLIGVVIADIESPFSSTLLKNAEQVLKSKSYSMIITNTNESYKNECEYLESLIVQGVDGIIVNTSSMNNPYLKDMVERNRLPIVLADRFVSGVDLDISFIDNENPIFNAFNHLKKQGYGSIGLFVQPYENISARFYRRESFKKQMAKYHIKQADRYVFPIEVSDDRSAEKALRNFLTISKNETGKPPAIIAANSVTLLSAAKAIHTFRLSVPQEIGLCGYDDWGWLKNQGWMDIVFDGITTMHASIENLASNIAHLMINRIAHPKDERRKISIPAPLTVRHSTMLRETATSSQQNRPGGQ
ncbi:MAG: LacI family DNA-binding transcriptional regulator [Sporolactobacillus sp.]|jgi:LacI family kdg operon repressor|nr:LacI family DNA-binding transcriptional regulator [Sporolactobacillus sp.]